MSGRRSHKQAQKAESPPMRPAAPAWRWVLLAGLAVIFAGVGIWQILRTTHRRPSAGRPNVLLITLDTTRADHLGCYGRTDAQTPHLDGLARSGVRFEHCTASAPQTLPSHASIMTGLYPFVHGVRRNGTDHLPESAATLAEALRDAGYATAAAVASSVLDAPFGIAQGFDEYRQVDPGSGELPRAERRGDEVCDDGLALLAKTADRPFFLWVHFFDPHFPYESAEHPDRESPAAYADEIRFMDTQVGRLLAGLAEHGVADNTLIVAVGDHGEGLEEHSEHQHGFFIYETTQHVPLILHAPRPVPAGRTIAAQVRTIDIAPTILDLLGVAAMPGLQGTSLRPLFTGQSEPPNLAAYAEAVDAHVMYGLSRLRSLTRGGWKYILSSEPELYDLNSDPAETHDLAAKQPERAAALRAELQALIAAAPPRLESDASAAQLSAAEIARLESLGYVAAVAQARSITGAEPESFEPTGESPRDFMRVISTAVRAHRLWIEKRYAEAEPLLRVVIELLPHTPDMQRELAYALDQQGKAAEAVSWYERALESTPDDWQTRLRYGLQLAKLERFDEARRAGEQVVRERPELVPAHLLLGLALCQLGQLGPAAEHYEYATRQQPNNVGAWFGLGLVYRRQGRWPEAEDCYRQVLRIDPGSAAAQAAIRAIQSRPGG